MQYKYVHMKFGTVPYPKWGDLLSSLSWATDALSSYTEPLQLDKAHSGIIDYAHVG